jgi:Na+/H+-translocating membrane pyrophosphatase
MSDDDTRAELAEIEERIEHLRDVIESCRKGMLASRAAIIAGGVVFVANLIGLFGSGSLLLALLSFTAIIAGIVWLGANRTSREQALASLRAAQSEWRAATDEIEMSTVGEQAP